MKKLALDRGNGGLRAFDTPTDVKLLAATLSRKRGVLWGRRRVQKVVALLKIKHCVPFSFIFRRRLGGVWSDELDETLASLCSVGLIEKRWRQTEEDPGGNTLYEEGYLVTSVGRKWLRDQDSLALAVALKPWAVDAVLRLPPRALAKEALSLNL